jgi:hypothetical protein
LALSERAEVDSLSGGEELALNCRALIDGRLIQPLEELLGYNRGTNKDGS